ncbi:MAG: beta-ketoacyl synthase chain length factor [Kofleriaceae bacterium]|nr:beta-ketoacyl synthase chain length factor [Kofleriaceae bacterium]
MSEEHRAPLFITGISLWSPGYASLAAFVKDDRDESVIDCVSPWVPARLGRGSSRLTRMLGEVAAAATSSAGASPDTVATVYGSALGEIETMILLLDAIWRGDGQLSPMRFKNSVHNAAGGLGSIGTANRAFSTAIAAGPRSFEASLLEAAAWLWDQSTDEGPKTAVVAVADDQVPEPLATLCPRIGLAVGLCLSTAGGAAALGVISHLRTQPQPRTIPTSYFGRELPHGLLTNPAAAGLALLEAVVERRSGTVPLAFSVQRPLAVDLVAGARAWDDAAAASANT